MRIMVFVFLFCTASLVMTAFAEPPVVQSSRLKLVFSDDLNGLASILDLKTGREYAAPATPADSLYMLALGRAFPNCTRLTSRDASRRSFERKGDALILNYEHEGEHPINLSCEVSARPDAPDVRWRINIRSRSTLPVFAVEFPRASLMPQLGDSVDDDAILYPIHEGALLCKPGRFFKKGVRFGQGYPGALSAQFLYFFDKDGGLYMAAADGAGHQKALTVAGLGDALSMAFTHFFPSEVRAETALPYDLVWTCGEGTWYAGADIYKSWAQKQPWCAKKLTERDVPSWLKEGNVFLNYDARRQGLFYPASAAIATLGKLRDFLGVPVVSVPFGWEKNGAWIGPDYFPPFGGEETYKEIVNTLVPKSVRLHMYLSGFRWGVKRPLPQKKGLPRKYTDYDGTKDFEARGRSATVVRPDGSLDFHQVPWADNYTLCVGSKAARDILAECYRKIFDWGVAGVDLDQNVGCGGAPCFSTEHGHPPGSGVWTHQAMSSFLSDVRKEAKAKDPDAFMGVEEPCEAYISYLDVYHGRAFTDTRWPAVGPGAVSIPLFAYLYHEYIIGYAGWCDEGFSPMGDPRIGLARALLAGMQPGVRHGNTFSVANLSSEHMRILRNVAALSRKASDYLVLGRMLHEPKVFDAPTLEQPVQKGWLARTPLPIPWSAVQATAWMSPQGNVCYAVANLTAQPQKPGIEIVPNGMKSTRFDLKRIGHDGAEPLRQSVELPLRIMLDLQPWEVCCIEQLGSAEQK